MKMKKNNASAVIYLIFFFTVFLAFCTFAIDGTIIFMNRAKLQNTTESAALAAAAEFDAQTPTSTADVATITDKAERIFAALNGNPLKPTGEALQGININVKVSLQNREVLITTEALSPTYFLGFLGVSSVKLQATALAVSEQPYVMASYPNINWITANAAYHTDVISKDLNLNDTAILTPIGDMPSASIDSTMKIVNFKLIEKDPAHPDQPLSLGPGGFITLKLPDPIIDKPGPDLFIKELGALEGYLVFAGLDNDPQNPYMRHDQPGGKISWKNITCSGIVKDNDSDNDLGAYKITTAELGEQAKFYGSGYFDLGAPCVGLSMAKYIRIIDDNDESAFAKNSLNGSDTKYYQTMMYGESSTPTAGADIDYVQVLNHVKLLKPSTFTPDTI